MTRYVIIPVRNSQSGLQVYALWVVGDILTVVRLDRLCLSLLVLVGTIEKLKYRRIEFRSLNERVDTTTPSGRLIFQDLRSVY